MPEQEYKTEREQLVRAVRDLDARGLVSGTSGNVSVRLPARDGDERYLVTPAGVSYETLDESGLVLVDGELEPVGEELVPSTESLMHLGIYRQRTDVNAIVHTHSLYASVAAATATDIPPILDEMVVYVGGPVHVAEYGFPGSAELAAAVVDALGDRRAVLLRNHGLCAAGGNLQEAMHVAILVERVAQVFVHAENIGGAKKLPGSAIVAERHIYLMRSGLTGSD